MKLIRAIVGVLALLALNGISPAAGGEPGNTHNVRDYGAKGDKTTNDTESIQRAMDAAAREETGVVVLPKGDYLAGELHLPSHVTLRPEEGATL